MKNPTPSPPPELLMQIANDPSVEAFVSSFPHVRVAVSDYLGRAGYRFGGFRRILDFGCGVGRFLFAMKEVLGPEQRMFGCDIDSQCIDWCSGNIDFAKVTRSQIAPPLPYRDGEFDLVYALSVFTHLSLDLQFAWAWEISRVLKPGGVLFVSTHGLMFLQQILAIRENWAHADLALFGATAMVGVFSEHGKSAIEGQREIAVVHTGEGVREVFSGMRLKYHDPVSYMAGGQGISIFEKPGGITRATFPDQESGLAEFADQLGGGRACSGIQRFGFSPLAESATLRFYLTFDHLRRDCSRFQVHCRIAIREVGVTVSDAMLPIPIHVASGTNHFLPFKVSVPPLCSRFEVSLQLALVPGNIPQSETVAFKWRLLRIES